MKRPTISAKIDAKIAQDFHERRRDRGMTQTEAVIEAINAWLDIAPYTPPDSVYMAQDAPQPAGGHDGPLPCADARCGLPHVLGEVVGSG
ncbi:MAG: hypothetical protein ACYDBQ_09245 [Thermoplasmatota archaeon]